MRLIKSILFGLALVAPSAFALTSVLPVNEGGTGQTTYTDGQLLIGNSTGNTLSKASLTAGTGISITPGGGSITINATGGTVGPGSTNAVAKFTGASAIGNSSITDDGTDVSTTLPVTVSLVGQDGAGAVKILQLGSDAETIGDGSSIEFVMNNSNTTPFTYATITGSIVDPSNPTETGKIVLDSNSIESVGPARFPLGSATTPSISFTSDTDTGIYGVSDNRIGVSTGGALVGSFSTSGLIMNNQILGSNAGTVSAPAYSRFGDTNTGLNIDFPDIVQLVTGGAARMSLNTTEITSTLPFRSPAGSAVAPAYSFSGDNDTGIYSVTSNQLGLSTAGTLRVTVRATDIINTLPILSGDGSAANPSYAFSSSSSTGQFSPASDVWGVSTGGTERMRIDSNGMGLRTSPYAWGSSNTGFDFGTRGGVGQVSASSEVVLSNNAYHNGTNWIYKTSSFVGLADLSASGSFHFYTAPSGTAGNTVTFTERFRVEQSTGDTYTNDGSVSSLSDATLKKGIRNLQEDISVLRQLRPVEFRYKVNAGLAADDGVTRYGFIAQEVESVAPQFTGRTTVKIEGVDTEVRTISTTRMIPMIVKSVQELDAENQQLRQDIAYLWELLAAAGVAGITGLGGLGYAEIRRRRKAA